MRTAHRRRFHRDRIVRKRQNAYRRLQLDRGPKLPERVLPDGRLEDRQAYLACGRPRCGLCHSGKRWHRGANRARALDEWRRLELEGWDEIVT
ncbi:MAG TPA: hypothetical protein VHF88_08175 [Thermoleophilaceae bacterium]|nr:hypothetical protein [Thermoleophilaceae bacterium]